MTGIESFEPSFSMRGNEQWRRIGRTILSRSDMEKPKAIPLSRTELQGSKFPVKGAEEESIEAINEEVDNG